MTDEAKADEATKSDAPVIEEPVSQNPMVMTPEQLKKRHGKNYATKAALIEKSSYGVAEAMELLTKISTSKFDATVEAHFRINADVTQADQLIRTTVAMPHGTGKSQKIAAFVPDDMVKEATEAGADVAGLENLISDVEGGKIDFEVAVAHPDVMKGLGKIAKILGQKGLMPNPKAGTVTKDIGKTIAELKQGRIEIKMDKQGIIHCAFGKVSFGAKKLEENFNAILQAIKDEKPTGIKGIYIASISISPSMGPGIRVSQ